MAALIEPKAGESFGDMACGSGLSLIALAEACEDSSPACKVYGQDINPIEASLAQMNLVMHGIDGHQIACGDSIRNPRFVVGGQQLQQFDVQVSHPPFAVDEWGYEEASNDPFGRYTYGIPPKNRSDYSFILHMVAMMKVGSGRMAVIVQKGVLTRGGAEAEIRRALLKDNLLDAVIDLPEKSCFGTVIQVSVMILRRDRVRRDVLFVDASKSFVAGKINTLSEADIEKIVGVYKDPHVSEGFSFLASVEDIEANDCSFAPHHYIKAESSKKVVSIDVLLARQKDLTVDLLSLQAEMDQIVAEAGIQ
ncbi:MAG: N-6 DNA methylase [Hafnia sp.]